MNNWLYSLFGPFFTAHPHISSVYFFDTNDYIGFAGTWRRDAGARRRRGQLAAVFAFPVAELLQTGGPASQRQEAPLPMRQGQRSRQVGKTEKQKPNSPACTIRKSKVWGDGRDGGMPNTVYRKELKRSSIRIPVPLPSTTRGWCSATLTPNQAAAHTAGVFYSQHAMDRSLDQQIWKRSEETTN